MSEKAFTSEEMLRRLRQVPELAYEFSAEEVLQAANQFLQYVGYQLQTLPEGTVKPDFHAQRQSGATVYEVMGLVGHSLTEMADLLAKLAALKSVLGEEVDYVLVFPPISERPLLDFLSNDKGKWYFELKEAEVMFWLCNPQQETVWCILGSPKDALFNEYFVLTKLSLDSALGMRLSQELLEEE